MSKEDRAGKENLPPTPPIREKGETEEICESIPRAREDSYESRRRFVNGKPSCKAAIQYVHAYKPDLCSDAMVAEWHGERTFMLWVSPTGGDILNWPYDLLQWVKYYGVRKRDQDPDRIPDARKAKAGPRHADNWRGTRKEDIGDVLG